MLNSLGIIPAAGKATRFGGTYKELLPVGPNNDTLLCRAVTTLGMCERTVLISTQEKIPQHSMTAGSLVIYMIASSINGMWGAMRLGMTIEAQRYYFVMPDTYIPDRVFDGFQFEDFAMGMFDTNDPGNFGVLHNGIVYDKNKDIPTPARAWGVLAWSKRVRDFWNNLNPDTYTQAINAAIGSFGYKEFPLKYYRDIANYQAYSRLLKDIDDNRL